VLADPVGSRLLRKRDLSFPSFRFVPFGPCPIARTSMPLHEEEDLSVTDFAEASLASMNESDYEDRRLIRSTSADMHDLIHGLGLRRDCSVRWPCCRFLRVRQGPREHRPLHSPPGEMAPVRPAGRMRRACSALRKSGCTRHVSSAVEWEAFTRASRQCANGSVSPHSPVQPIRYDLWCSRASHGVPPNKRGGADAAQRNPIELRYRPAANVSAQRGSGRAGLRS
jgi:hypothetical protein